MTDYPIKSSYYELNWCVRIAVGVLGFWIGLFQSGCATMVRGNSDVVIVDSNPSGAEVRLSTGQYGVTPCEFELKRKRNVRVTIFKKGYKEVNTALIPTIDGGSFALGTAVNFLFLPVINDIVDYNSGANYSLKPNPLFVQLIREESSEEYQRIDPREMNNSQKSELYASTTVPTETSSAYLLGFKRVQENYAAIALRLGVPDVYGPLLPINAPELNVELKMNDVRLQITNKQEKTVEELIVAITENNRTYWIGNVGRIDPNDSISLNGSDFTNEIEGLFSGSFADLSRIEIWAPDYLLLTWEAAR